MDDATKEGCKFLGQLVRVIGPRSVQVLGVLPPPLIIYSDAMFQPEYWDVPEAQRIQPRMGWVIFDPISKDKPRARTMEIPHAALELVLPRTQQIFACEALAVPAAQWKHRRLSKDVT